MTTRTETCHDLASAEDALRRGGRATYRGQICVTLTNTTLAPYAVKHGDKIAQLVLERVYRARFEPVDELDESERGEGAFGSSGR